MCRERGAGASSGGIKKPDRGCHYGHYDADEEYVSWYVSSDGKYAPAVSADGSIYGMGQLDNNISNALYAHQWNLAPSEIGWYRANGDNANTRWVGGQVSTAGRS